MKSLFGFPNVKGIAVPATSFLHWENIADYLTKRQVHKMYVFKMFVTAVFVIFLIMFNQVTMVEDQEFI